MSTFIVTRRMVVEGMSQEEALRLTRPFNTGSCVDVHVQTMPDWHTAMRVIARTTVTTVTTADEDRGKS
jgi:hypothetical protein